MQIFDQMDLLAFDFQRHLHLDLGESLRSRPWPWFVGHVHGLMSLAELIVTPKGVVPVPASLIAAHFYIPEENDDE